MANPTNLHLLQRAHNALRNLGDAPPAKPDLSGIWFQNTAAALVPGIARVCALCEKPYAPEVTLNIHGVQDPVCKACESTYADCATVVCELCHTAVAKIPPKLLDNGFYIKPRSVLHGDSCNVCRPGVKVTLLREIDDHQRRYRSCTIVAPGRTIMIPSDALVRKLAPTKGSTKIKLGG